MAAPPPVPALPDTQRLTTYVIAAQVGPFDVGFAIYGDGSDYVNWLEVWLDDIKLTAVTDWTLSLTSGLVAIVPRPIQNARVTLTAARTGTLKIIGARRPRRLVQFNENQGVNARDLNVAITDLIAQNREAWDLGTNSATKQYVDGQNSLKIAKAGDTMTGPLNMSTNTFIGFNSPTPDANSKQIIGYVNNVPRWDVIVGDSGAETGGNAGSDFRIRNFSDGGASLGDAITIARSNGQVALNGVPGASRLVVNDLGATTAYHSVQITRTEALNLIGTEGGQNAALSITVTGNNISAFPVTNPVAQPVGALATVTQIGTGDAVGYFSWVNNSSPDHYSYGAFFGAGTTGTATSGAIGVQLNVANHTGVSHAFDPAVYPLFIGLDIPYQDLPAGGGKDGEVGVYLRKNGNALSGAWHTGLGFADGSCSTNLIKASNFTVTVGGAITLAGNITLNNDENQGSLLVGTGNHRIGRVTSDGSMRIGGGQASILFSSVNPVSVLNTTVATTPTTGALTVAGGAGIAGSLYVGASLVLAAATAGIELGLPGTTNTPFIDFHSSASSTDYDVRLLSSGGTGANGHGTLTVSGDIVSLTGALTVGTNITATGYKVGANQVVGARVTGYTPMTGSPDKATAYATSTVTLAQLAGRVAQMQADLTAQHGLLGA